jgi:hypothetical protein
MWWRHVIRYPIKSRALRAGRIHRDPPHENMSGLARVLGFSHDAPRVEGREVSGTEGFTCVSPFDTQDSGVPSNVRPFDLDTMLLDAARRRGLGDEAAALCGPVDLDSIRVGTVAVPLADREALPVPVLLHDPRVFHRSSARAMDRTLLENPTNLFVTVERLPPSRTTIVAASSEVLPPQSVARRRKATGLSGGRVAWLESR